MEIWEYMRKFLPLNGTTLGNGLSVLFYAALLLFLLAFLLDLALKAIRRLFCRKHEEHRIKRTAKKVLHISIGAKLSYIVISFALMFFKALAISEWLRKFIAEPKSAIDLIKGNWLFFAVLGCLLLFRRRRSQEL